VFKILHITPMVGKRSFGIGPIPLNLAESQQYLGHHTEIWTCDSKAEITGVAKNSGLAPESILTFPFVGPERLSFSPEMGRMAARKGCTFQILHQHGIWTAMSLVTNLWRDQTNLPTIIAPHGSLDPWALKRSNLKKQIALSLYERKNLARTSCLHALSHREADGFRQYGLQNPIAVISNGIATSWMICKGDGKAFRQRHAIPETARLMLFLGRITPIKGLLMLVQALSEIKWRLGDWMLCIAGVDEFSHQAEVDATVRQLSLTQYVKFVGPQFDQEKRDAFAAAEMFVLPSYSEGAPVAILEALGADLPVLTTHASPWEDLLTHRCGWWCDISVNAITESLQEAINQPRSVLMEMGQRGKVLARDQYAWSQIAQQTILLYEWLLGLAPQPNFVTKD
jgi:glycosyltransferase involved in cell wall biosynthesis